MRYATRRLPIAGCLGIASIALLLCLAAPSRAEKLSPAQVALAAENWVRRAAPKLRPNATIKEVKPYEQNGEIVAHIVHFDGGGFCFCGADDVLKPVYLYNPHGKLDPEVPDYKTILRRIAASRKRIKALEQQGDPDIDAKITVRRMRWLDLLDSPAPTEMTEGALAQNPPMKMSLNLTTMWHQGRPGPNTHSRYNTFNKMCPILTPATYADPNWTLSKTKEHCLVGCPATAASQIMCYWKWPESGSGSETIQHPYRWWPTYSSTSTHVRVDPAQCIIDSDWPWGGRLEWYGNSLVMKGYWEISLYKAALKLYNGVWSEPDIQLFTEALTTLYDSAPYSATDPYTVDLSAATYRWDLMADKWDDALPQDSRNAMRLICYHTGVAIMSDYGVKGSGSDESRTREGFVNLLRFDSDATVVGPPASIPSLISDIQWLRPVQIRGTDPDNGGHWWVIYGYDSYAGLFQMNMGWGEGNHSVWCDLEGDADFGHTEYQAHIEMLAPTNVKFVGADNSGDGSPDNPYEDIEEALFGDVLHGSVPVADDSVLVFKAGTINTFAVNTLVIDRPLTLRGYDVTIRRQ